MYRVARQVGDYILLTLVCAAVYLILLEQLQIWQNRHGMYATWCNSQIIVYKMYSHRPEGSPCNVIAANYVALLLGVR